MTNRLVQLVSASNDTVTKAGHRQFADYKSIPFLVLLGDPGAGNSHLFRHSAAEEGATYVTVRSFLNRPPFPEGQSFYIDALDEKRSGRDDTSILDEVVRKLFLSKPSRIRLSCRAQDWLGKSDLTALRDYSAKLITQ